ncbi:MAG: acetyl-CoA carboxylase biotin carboxyl carrier protein [Beijerinckiaceae bacterium]
MKDDDEKHETEAQTAIDPQLVEQLAGIAVKQGLAEIEVRQGKLRIRVTRQHAQPGAVTAVTAPMAAVAPAAPAPAASAHAKSPGGEPAGDHPGAIRSPMVGTIYLRPEPSAEKFVEVGSVVRQGDKLMLIEAMKTFNDITAPRAGTVTAIMVNEGEPVEFGEPLLVIE